MAQRRSFSIQSFRQQQGVDQAAAQKLWSSLKIAIGEIYNQNASSLSFEELYRNAYNLVLHKHYDLIYEGVKSTFREHLSVSLVGIVESSNEDMLRVLVNTWMFHKVAFNMIKDILMYMDRAYCAQRKKAPVYTLALQLFREVIIYHTSVRTRLQGILLNEISKERRGMVIDRGLVKSVLQMLEELGIDGTPVYEDEFEGPFIEATKQFYKQESLEFLSINTCQDYVLKAETRLEEEAARMVYYISDKTEPKLRSAVELELISVHARTLLHMDSTGFLCMLRDNKLADLGRFYALFVRIPHCVQQLRDAMCEYVKQEGMTIVATQVNQKDPVLFVRTMLDLKDKFDIIIKDAFRADKSAQKRLQDAFEDFVNKDNQCAASLASFMDDMLRGGIQGATEQEIEDKLDKAIVLFKYLSDKDIFENYYKHWLCKRLLSGKTVSDEAEKLVISKLKAECGYQFTSKLEGMFLDINISKSVQEEFRSSAVYQQNLHGIDMELHVLTTGYWPLTPTAPCQLPPTLRNCCSVFASHYLEKNSGRRLTWLPHLGSVDVKANFPQGRKELNVSTYQMCILALFNDSVTVSLEAIRDATQIPELELKRHLLSLCTAKFKVLKKQSKGKGIEETDNFTFNREFNSKFKRMKIPLISVKEVMTPAEATAAAAAGKDGSSSSGMDAMGGPGSDIPTNVEEDRRLQLEAAIVRIMKSRKTLTHNELVAEATRQLSQRFVPSPPFIKKRVESLIEREYLQRSTDDARVYHYLA